MILSIRLTFKTFGMTKFALLLSNSLKENRENQINFFLIPHTPVSLSKPGARVTNKATRPQTVGLETSLKQRGAGYRGLVSSLLSNANPRSHATPFGATNIII